MKGHARNLPCDCGSGKKAKKCHPEGWPPPVKIPTRTVTNTDPSGDYGKPRLARLMALAAVLGMPVEYGRRRGR